MNKGPQLYHIRLEIETGPNLTQLHLIELRLVVGMMPETDEIVVVSEGKHSFGVRFGHGEETLQDLLDPEAELGVHIVKNEVRRSLTHRVGPDIQVMPQNRVLNAEVDSRPNGHMADNQAVRLPSVLVDHYYITEALPLGDVDQVLDLVGSPVEADGVGEHEVDLLLELEESLGGGPRRGQHDVGLHVAVHLVLVVDVGSLDEGVFVFEGESLLQLFFLGVELCSYLGV